MSARSPLRVFYDGECGLCSRVLAWALARDRDSLLAPEPYQSALAASVLGSERERAARELIVWSKDAGLRSGAPAVAALLARLPGWRWAGALLDWAPVRPLARAGYRWVAARRQWFGSPTCALPGRRAQARNDSNLDA